MYAKGRRAWGECARSGKRMLLNDMVADGYYPDLIVDPAWRDERHPQEHIPGLKDATTLYRPAPMNLPPPTDPVLTLAVGVDLTWTEAVTKASQIKRYEVWRSQDVEADEPNFLRTFTHLADVLVERDAFGAITNSPYDYTDDTTESDSFYFYFIRAIPEQGPHSRSNIEFYADLPTTPVLTGEHLPDPDNFLEWTESTSGVGEIDNYLLYRAVDGGAFTLLDTLPGDQLNYDDTDIVEGSTYQYYVVAVDSFGQESADSNIVELEYPLPASGITFISFINRTVLASSNTFDCSQTFNLDSDGTNVALMGHHMLSNGNTLTQLATRRIIVTDSLANELYNEEVFLDTIFFTEITANVGQWLVPLGDLPAGTYTVNVRFTYNTVALRRVQMQAAIFTGVNQDDLLSPWDSVQSYDDVAPQSGPLELFPDEIGQLVFSTCATGGTSGDLTAVTDPAFDDFEGSLTGSAFKMNIGYVIAQSTDTQSIDWADSEDGGHYETAYLLRPAA